MTWLILIVRLGRAAPRHRRRVYAELSDGGAVPVSDGVWGIPDTGFHRAAVNMAERSAAAAGGDLLILETTPENAPSHAVLEAKLAERLNAEAAAIHQRCDAFAGGRPGAPAMLEYEDRAQAFMKLQHDALRLSDLDVIGLEAVASATARVTQTVRLRGAANAA